MAENALPTCSSHESYVGYTECVSVGCALRGRPAAKRELMCADWQSRGVEGFRGVGGWVRWVGETRHWQLL